AAGDQHHRGPEVDQRQSRHPPHRADGQDPLLHHHSRRHRRGGRDHRLQGRTHHRASAAGLLHGLSMRTIALTTVAMVAFAANSVRAGLAFAPAGAEPLSYTGIRLAAGALTLVVLLAIRRQSLRLAGSWSGAAALFGYAILFSIAYILLGAGTG